MSKDATKCLTCQHCRFNFEVPISTQEFDGCYTPAYCEQKYLQEWAHECLSKSMGDTTQG